MFDRIFYLFLDNFIHPLKFFNYDICKNIYIMLETIVLNKISQMQKDKNQMFSLIQAT